MSTGGYKYPISLWENFLPLHNDDNTTPVRCQWESRMFRMPNDESFQACFIEVFVTHVYGDVTLKFSIGGISGLYTLLSTSVFRADTGPFFSQSMPTIYYVFPGQEDTVIESYRPQNRYARSSEAVISTNPNSAHMIEVGYSNFIDKGFQALLQWTGNMAIRGIKFYYRPFSTPSVGQLPVDESSTPHIVLEAQ